MSVSSSSKKASRNQVSEEHPVPIRTSQLVANINRAAFAARYSVFRVETDDEWFQYGAEILDEPLLDEQKLVAALSFDGQKCFYVMTNKDQGGQIRRELLRVLQQDKRYGNKVKLTEDVAESILDHVLVRLLLVSLAAGKSDNFSFNNLTGRLYCIVPQNIEYSGRTNKRFIAKVPCVEVYISSNMKLSLSVRTFTSLMLKNKMDFSKRRLNQFPRYVFSETQFSLRRKLEIDSNDSECFILKQTKGARSTIVFLDIASYSAFAGSKMGILQQVMSRFHTRYGDLCTLTFDTVEQYTLIEMKQRALKENKDAIVALFKSKQVRIVDMIGGRSGEAFCLTIKGLLKETYDVDASVIASIEKEIREDCLNICAIHNRAWYEGHGQEDPHTTSADASVQHVTYEDFGGNEKAQKAAIKAVVHELLIKNDLVHNRITLFDWGSLALSEDVVFGLMCYKEDKDNEDNDRKNKEQYFVFIKIAPDGSFTLDRCDERDRFHSEWKECLDALLESKDVLGIIKRAGGINCICNTGLFGVPEIDKIAHELSEGNTYLRGQERRDELLPSILDIKSFQKEGCIYYLAGTIGDGMQSSVPDAVNIRRIVPFGDSSLMFDDLLPLMNVTFVHNERLTVIPFPFKYLREWAVQTGGAKQESKEE